jgi:hypothetical protein
MWLRTRDRIRDGVELWSTGNRESWRKFLLDWNGLLWYTIRNHHWRRLAWPRRFEGRRVVRLRSASDVERWLAGQAPGAERS